LEWNSLSSSLSHTISGITVGLKNWLRISFAIEHSSLEDGLGRIKAFYHRHAKKE
ncbi:nicotianamine aminotransferase 1-like, partial [Fagus crenata]